MTRVLRWFRAACILAIVVILAAVALLPEQERVSSNSDELVWRHLSTTTARPTTTTGRLPQKLVGQTGPAGVGGGGGGRSW